MSLIFVETLCKEHWNIARYYFKNTEWNFFYDYLSLYYSSSITKKSAPIRFASLVSCNRFHLPHFTIQSSRKIAGWLTKKCGTIMPNVWGFAITPRIIKIFKYSQSRVVERENLSDEIINTGIGTLLFYVVDPFQSNTSFSVSMTRGKCIEFPK